MSDDDIVFICYLKNEVQYMFIYFSKGYSDILYISEDISNILEKYSI